MEVGDIVDVVVTRPEIFGFFCQCGHTELLVTIPETSWIASFDSCHQFTDPGDVHKVMVIQVDTARLTVAASIRRMSPDPWATGLLFVGAEHSATVIRRVEHADRCGGLPGYLLELVPGGYAMLCNPTTDLDKGSTCRVVIEEADPARRLVRISLA